MVELFTSVVDRKFHFRGTGPKPRILMVDDEIDYLMLLKLKLVNEGFDIASADNAEDALVSMEKDPPDLVVSDVLMPGMDGIAMFRRMREANAPWETPPSSSSAAGTIRRSRSKPCSLAPRISSSSRSS